MSAPATILRKRHNLQGKGGLVLLRRLRAFSSEVNSWARFTGSVDTLSLTPEELATRFEDLCGEEVGSLEAFLQLAGREATVENRRLACHLAIILANEIGQPKGQELRQENPGTSRTDQQEGAAAKRPRTDQPEDRPDNDVVARLGKLESAMKASTESTEGAKAKVGDVKGSDQSSWLPVIPAWEKEVPFKPLEACREQRKTPQWVSLALGGEGNQTSAQVCQDNTKVTEVLDVRDPDNFVAGELHKHLQDWKSMMSEEQSNSSDIVYWISEGVGVESFFRHFKGNFRGKSYDTSKPPRAYFENSRGCKKFGSFIAAELCNRIKSGAVRLWGRIGECQLPRVVMPLVVEPSKPRLCHDDRFINLWTKDLPFSLDTLKDVHRMVDKGARMITCDEKSGYDHVSLTEGSQTYFGIQFGGWVMSCTTLPFGWKASPFIYQSVGMVVTNYLREEGVNTAQYIDDRFAVSRGESCRIEGEEDRMVACIVSTLTRLGYTLALRKCQLFPATSVKYLGFIVDSERQAYLLPGAKKDSFKTLREHILAQDWVDIKALQRFAGKCVSMALVVPGAKLYCREVNRAISQATVNSKLVKMNGALKKEIEHWRFLDSWEGCFPWRKESHQQLWLATDASLFKYGAVVLSGDRKGESFGDFWGKDDERPIHLKEAEAILRAVKTLGAKVVNHRLDVLSDNQAVIQVWDRQGGRDQRLNDIMKDIFQLTLAMNVDLKLSYVPSKLNVADAPSRSISLADSMLSPQSWARVEDRYDRTQLI